MGRIGAHGRDPAYRADVVDDVDHAPVGKRGDGEARHARQRRLVVERGAEDGAGLGKEGELTASGLELHAGAALGAVQSGLLDRDGHAPRDPAQDGDVVIIEGARRQRADMQDTEKLVPHLERHAEH